MESKLYNPAGQPKDWLIANFVARTKVFERIFKDLQAGKMQYPEQHYLIQGQRGMGKTTLLLRLKYEIENTPELNQWMIPVFFNEESYDLTSLSNLWEKLLKYLDSTFETGGEFYSATSEFIGYDDYEKKCFDLLLSVLERRKKKLVIFFDNFGQLFLDNLKEKEQRRLREILMNCNDIRIIGASAVVLHDLHDYSKPFYEFFKIINLEGLNKDETFQLITKLQENAEKKINIEKSKNKIETLAILTGGVIRTIMLIYEVILADEDGSALHDLEIILDRITPLYKHRIEDLPVQQRKIIDVIAKRWDAISTKDIAENIREEGKPMATKLISAQLQQLEKNNVIEKKQTTTKNHLYQLKERFFNIWYLMRNGDRFDRCRVMWLTKFLETWYDDDASINSFIRQHIELLNSGKYYADSAIMIAEALTNSSKVDFLRQATLIKATESILDDKDKQRLPEISIEKYKQALKYYEEKNYYETIKLFESMEQTSPDANNLLVNSYLSIEEPLKAIKALSPNNESRSVLLGRAYLQLEEYNKAIKYLEDALNIEADDFEFKSEIANIIGWLYETEKGDNKKALKYYKIAVEYGNESAYDSLLEIHLKSKEFDIAEKYYLKAIESGKTKYKKELIDLYIFRLYKKEDATALIKSGRREFPLDVDYLYYEAILLYLYDEKYNKAELMFLKVKNSLKKENKTDHINYYMTLVFLTSLYIDTPNNANKAKAIKTVKEIDVSTSLDYLLSAITYLWDNQFNSAFTKINKYYDLFGKSKIDIINEPKLLLLLLAKKQYHFALKLFENEKNDFKDRFKPIYYVLMHYLKDEYPNEYLKMGEELRQPVKDIMETVEKMVNDYA